MSKELDELTTRQGATYWCEQYRLWRQRHDDLLERHMRLLDAITNALEDLEADIHPDPQPCIMCGDPFVHRNSNVCNACWRAETGE